MKWEIGEESITPVLDRLNNAIRINGALGESIANIAVDEVLENFETQGSNIGEPWPPLAASTIRQRRKKGKGSKPLRDTGQLIGSIHSEVHSDRIEVVASRTTDSKKGNVDVSWVHNYGDRRDHTPARPFMGMSQEGKADVEDLVHPIIAQVRK